jgi:hypothetical protein
MNSPKIDRAQEQIVAENLDFLRDVVEQQEVSNAQLRRSSIAMRHLVYEDQLQRCAFAREHEIRVLIPETKALARDIEQDKNVLYFQLGGYRALGLTTAALTLELGTRPAPRPYDPNVTFEAKMKTYKKGLVIFIRAAVESTSNQGAGTIISGSISRETLIKYVAHKAGGAHYDHGRASKEDQLLDILRKTTSVVKQDGIATWNMNSEALLNPHVRANLQLPGLGALNKDHLDPVLLELLGCAKMLVDSPSIVKLRTLLEV